jgi:hypothetical protein
MTAIATTRTPLAQLHERFSTVLPSIQSEAQDTFRNLRCEQDREDAISETVLDAWKKFLRLVTEYSPIDPMELARRAVASVARRIHRQSLLAA